MRLKKRQVSLKIEMNAVFSRFIVLAILCTSSTNLWSQSDSVTLTIGREISLPSTVLNEERTIWVYTPPAYNQDSLACPVLYLLDGQWHFRHVVLTVNYLSRHLKVPPMIVVGIASTNRFKDFYPVYTSESEPGHFEEDSARVKDNDFLRFLQEELIPYIERNYRTQPFRILEGHSLGAMFAINILRVTPGLFNSYIVISAAFYKDKSTLAVIEGLGKFLSDNPQLHKSVFITVGSEWDLIHQGVDSLVHQLKNFAPPSLSWNFKQYPDEDHNSVPFLSMYDGLRFIFSNWPIDVSDSIKVTTFDMLKNHYETISREFGYKITPPRDVVELFGYELLYIRNKTEDAIMVFKENIKDYPASSSSYQGLGEAYMIKGQKELAIESFEKSLSINPNNERGRKMLEKLRKME